MGNGGSGTTTTNNNIGGGNNNNPNDTQPSHSSHTSHSHSHTLNHSSHSLSSLSHTHSPSTNTSFSPPSASTSAYSTPYPTAPSASTAATYPPGGYGLGFGLGPGSGLGPGRRHTSRDVDDDDDDDDSNHNNNLNNHNNGAEDTASPSSHGGNSLTPQPDGGRDDGGGGGPSNSKKRKAGPGSRGVANLTPEQLAKKRANDRDAQRAIRERQKLRNEHYEREIRELKSQQPYQELQSVLRQKAAVEAELADIKSCLASMVALIQPILTRPPVDQTTLPTSPENQAHLSVQQPPPFNPGSTPTSAASPASVVTLGRWQSELSPVAPPMKVMSGQPQTQDIPIVGQVSGSAEARLLDQRHELIHGLELGPERLELDFLLGPNQKIARIPIGVDGAQDSPHFRHVPMKHDWTAIDNPAPQAHPSPPPVPPFGQPNGPPSIPRLEFTAVAPTSFGPTGDMWAMLPKYCEPTCPLDNVLLDFLAERRQRAAEGMGVQEIIGPRYPSVSSLLNPAVSRWAHPLSRVFTDILATFPHLAKLPERVAVLYCMFLFMRWLLSPTPENYARLPAHLRPGPLQLTKPHPAWFDYMPFPQQREHIIRNYNVTTNFTVDNFFIPFTSTISVNWPYQDTDTLLQSPVGDELMINPVFERHIFRIENWTVGDDYVRTFPDQAPFCNVRSESAGGIIKPASS
ncbi:hypothetical protein B0T17DRAFT_483130 [Bombardia bombarda]|uniref:BZIP transcription factor n=1 Tax=Bombardia bombarda TaxID=252184 RepID=A0AA39XJA4_9PEZI|nr:hypothetical protein B0T17DRAFT_483130 [Bombardia bombarda]